MQQSGRLVVAATQCCLRMTSCILTRLRHQASWHGPQHRPKRPPNLWSRPLWKRVTQAPMVPMSDSQMGDNPGSKRRQIWEKHKYRQILQERGPSQFSKQIVAGHNHCNPLGRCLSCYHFAPPLQATRLPPSLHEQIIHTCSSRRAALLCLLMTASHKASSPK